MRNTVFIVLFLLSSIAYHVDAQVNYTLDGVNKLYVGLDNPITVKTQKGTSNKRATLFIEGAEIIPLGGGENELHFFVRVPDVGNYKLTIAIDGKIVVTSTLRGRLLMLPIPSVGGQGGGKIAATKFRVQIGMVGTHRCFGCDDGPAQNVVRFKLLRIDSQGKRTEYTNEGQSFTGDMRKAIDAARPGDVYIFYDIYLDYQHTKNIRKAVDVTFILE